MRLTRVGTQRWKKDEKRPTVLAKHLVSMTSFGQFFSLSLIQFGQNLFFTPKKLGRESAGIRRETAGIRRETARSQIWTIPFSGFYDQNKTILSKKQLVVFGVYSPSKTLFCNLSFLWMGEICLRDTSNSG